MLIFLMKKLNYKKFLGTSNSTWTHREDWEMTLLYIYNILYAPHSSFPIHTPVFNGNVIKSWCVSETTWPQSELRALGMPYLPRKILFLTNFKGTYICFSNRSSLPVIFSSFYYLRKQFPGFKVYRVVTKQQPTLESLTPWDNYS